MQAVNSSGKVASLNLNSAGSLLTAGGEGCAPSTMTVYNVTTTVVDTEYSQALPAICRRVSVYNRDGNAARLAFVTGKVATPTAPYLTIPAGGQWDSGPVRLAAATVYFAAGAGDVIEIEAWS